MTAQDDRFLSRVLTLAEESRREGHHPFAAMVVDAGGKALAHRLETREGAIGVLEALPRGRHLRVRLLAMRWPFRVMIKEAWLAEGLAGVLRF